MTEHDYVSIILHVVSLACLFGFAGFVWAVLYFAKDTER